MVTKGSPVRVRQRALGKPPHMAAFCLGRRVYAARKRFLGRIWAALERERRLTCRRTRSRIGGKVRIERTRDNVFTVVATGQELSALVAGARMALEAMRRAPEPPPAEAVGPLERVL